MRRWQIYVPDSLDRRFRDYLHKRFSGRIHGKLTEVIIEALERFLDEEEMKGREESEDDDH